MGFGFHFDKVSVLVSAAMAAKNDTLSRRHFYQQGHGMFAFSLPSGWGKISKD
jgi:hypothetical protein